MPPISDEAETGPAQIEDSFAISCISQVREVLRLKKVKDLSAAIHQIVPDVAFEFIERCLGRQTVGKEVRARVAQASFIILARSAEKVLKWYVDKDLGETADYLRALLKKRVPDVEVPHASSHREAAAIFENWTKLSREKDGGHQLVRPGIYQLFRRYKPLDGQGRSATAHYGDPANHYVIVELCHVDDRRCLLITSELKAYEGTVHINHERILFSLLQRHVPRGAEQEGLNHRFICLRLSSTPLSFYSGISIKVGDTTHQPLASECIFLPILAKAHPELDAEFKHLLAARELPAQVASDSVMADYITSNPSSEEYPSQEREARSRRVRDFPLFLSLARPRGLRPALFREPSRTLDERDIRSVEEKLTVFRQSGTVVRTS